MTNRQMKIMIAYDNSSFADAAIEDLRRAGLPHTGKAVVVSAADTLITDSLSVSETIANSVVSRRAMTAVSLLEEQAATTLATTRLSTFEASRRVREILPGWTVVGDVLQGAATVELLRKADEWEPDLIVVGSHGRGAVGRFFLGSVSQSIAEEASCAVRVARRGFEKTSAAPTKIIAGASSLSDAERVVKAISRRVWSNDTHVRLVAIDDGVAPGRISAVYPYARAIYELCADDLRAAGLQVSVDIEAGYPKNILLEKAEQWEADAIFVAANDDGESWGVGATAASLVTGAICSVEIVR